ncbi:MAG: LytTR family transcriptional regulator DNA-binding domain-containing protein [Bacteroidia bacterium]
MFALQTLIHFTIRLFFALLASHFIVVHDASETWTELFTKEYYYWSLLYSMVIAFVLIEYIYRITLHLNSTFLGFNLNKERLVAQSLKGFFGASILSFLLAAILFWLNGQNIFESNYFEKLYASILLFIFTVNVVYMLYYHYQAVPKTRYQVLRLDQSILDSEIRNLPALIFYEKRLCIAVDFNGSNSILAHTMGESIDILNKDTYFQINRKVVVNRVAISAVKPFGVRQLKIELRIDVNLPDSVELVVSKRKLVAFKQWLKGNS